MNFYKNFFYLNLNNILLNLTPFFILFYISADLPKLYIVLVIIFLISPHLWRFPRIKIIFFLPALFIFLFYAEPLFYYSQINYSEIKELIWGPIVFLLILLFNSHLDNIINNPKKLLISIFFGSLCAFLIIIFFNLIFFDYPITRNGYIHPFSKTEEGYLFLNLNYLATTNAISINNFYTIIHLWITVCLGLLALNKFKNIITAIIIILFIIGSTFGSKFFYTYFFFINLFFFLCRINIRYFAFILFSTILILSLNITIFSFIKKDNYIKIFTKNNLIKIDENYAIEIDKKNLDTLYNKDLELFLQNDYYFFKKNDEIYRFKSNIINEEYSRSKIINNNNYKNSFSINPNTYNTSFLRTEELLEMNKNNNNYVISLNFFNRLFILIEGYINLPTRFQSIFQGSEYGHEINKKILENLKKNGYSISLIFHNLFLDSFYNFAYLASFVLIYIYALIFVSYKKLFSMYSQIKTEHFALLGLMNFFLYEQFFQTSILAGKSTFFLFSLFYFLLLKIKIYYSKI
jgi:hypothetical protein